MIDTHLVVYVYPLIYGIRVWQYRSVNALDLIW